MAQYRLSVSGTPHRSLLLRTFARRSAWMPGLRYARTCVRLVVHYLQHVYQPLGMDIPFCIVDMEVVLPIEARRVRRVLPVGADFTVADDLAGICADGAIDFTGQIPVIARSYDSIRSDTDGRECSGCANDIGGADYCILNITAFAEHTSISSLMWWKAGVSTQ